MRSVWFMIPAVAVAIALAPGAATGQDLFKDTFEGFTLGQVAAQGSWLSYSEPDKSLVVNTPVYAGTKALDMQHMTYSARQCRALGNVMSDGVNNVVTYYLRMGQHWNYIWGGAYFRFYWEGEIGYPNCPTLIQTQLYDTGGLYYVDPGSGSIVNTGKTLADDTWYKFRYEYTPSLGKVRWTVDPAPSGWNVLDVTISGEPTGLSRIYEMSWQASQSVSTTGFHIYLDDVSVSSPTAIPPQYANFSGFTYVTPATTDDLILPTTQPNNGYLSTQIAAFASPGEYEPATFSIYATSNLTNVTMQAGPLTSGSNTIPAEAVDIRVVKCWWQGRTGSRYLTPEMLLKDDAFVSVNDGTKTNALAIPFAPTDAATLQPFAIPANTLKQLWVTFHVPDNAVPGVYTGVLNINADNGQTAQMNIRLEVLPIQLAKPLLDYIIYYGASRYSPSQGESWKSILGEYVLKRNATQYTADLQNLKAHGITIPMITQDLVRTSPGVYNFTRLEQDMNMVQAAGFSQIPLFYMSFCMYQDYTCNIGTQQTPEEIAEMEVWVSQVIALARSHGFTDAYFYGIDEASQPEVLLGERPSWQAVHALGGKVFVAAYNFASDWFNLVGDLLDLDISGGPPLATHIDEIHAMGHKMYNMHSMAIGSAKVLTTRANYGLGHWLAGFDGSCDFAYFFPNGLTYDDTDGANLDYCLVYPTTNGVIDTLNWEGWREAVDDVRYLTTLKAAIDYAKSRGLRPALVQQAEQWMLDLRATSPDPNVYYANSANWDKIDCRIDFAGRDIQTIRRQMADQIVALQAGIVTGTVNLADFSGDITQVPVTVTLRQGEGVIRTETVNLDSGGRFTVYSVDAGTYSVSVKGPHWLAEANSTVVVQ